MNNAKSVPFSALYAIPNRNGVYVSKDNHGFGTSIINMGELFRNDFIRHGEDEKVNLNHNEKETSLLEDGDLLFARRSLVESGAGKCSIVMAPTEELTFESSVIRIRLDKSIADPLFYYYWFKSNTGKRAMRTLVTGSNVKGIKGSELGTLDVPYVNVKTQLGISNIFWNIDKKIRNNTAICSDLESMAKLLYDYWFVQFDFPDVNGRPYKSSGGKMVWNEKLKREIPDGWGITTVGDITICRDSERIPVANKDRENMKGDIPYYGATGIMGYVNKAIFSGDYVLMAEDGSVMDEYGHPIVQRVSGDVWINNHAHVLEPRGKYSCRLLMMILKDVPVVKIKTGSIQMKINQENMNAYEIVSIPDNLIEAINKPLSLIDTHLLSLQSENQQLASLRDFLLPMLMNGQVKVGKAGV